MRIHHLTTIAFLALGAACTADATAPGIDDPVRASFEREFSHEPVPAPPAAGQEAESDILYELVNVPLRSGAAGSDSDAVLLAGAEQ
jgi:hypothetical protein